MNYITEQTIVEMRYTYDKLLSFVDVLDNKLALLMEGCVLIIMTLAAVGIVKGAPPAYWIVLEIVAVLFTIGITYVLVHWAPSRYPFAFPANWTQLAEHYLGLGDDEAKDVIIMQYIEVIGIVTPMLDKKAKAANWGLVTIALLPRKVASPVL